MLFAYLDALSASLNRLYSTAFAMFSISCSLALCSDLSTIPRITLSVITRGTIIQNTYTIRSFLFTVKLSNVFSILLFIPFLVFLFISTSIFIFFIITQTEPKHEPCFDSDAFLFIDYHNETMQNLHNS